MAFALPLFAHFFGLIQETGARKASPSSASHPAFRAPARPLSNGPVPASAESALSRSASLQRSWSGPTRAVPCQRPLRVLRVVDGRSGSAEAAGRMVISGRMADVCAELDRLAASETRH